MPLILQIAIGVAGGYGLVKILTSDWLQENGGDILKGVWIFVSFIAACLALIHMSHH